jgi:hypothetical protein
MSGLVHRLSNFVIPLKNMRIKQTAAVAQFNYTFKRLLAEPMQDSGHCLSTSFIDQGEFSSCRASKTRCRCNNALLSETITLRNERYYKCFNI